MVKKKKLNLPEKKNIKEEWQVHLGLPSLEIHIFYSEKEAQQFARDTFALSLDIQRGPVAAPRVTILRVVRHF